MKCQKKNPNSEAIKLKVLGSGVIELLGRQVGRKWQTHSFFYLGLGVGPLSVKKL